MSVAFLRSLTAGIVVALSFGSASCIDESRFQVGYATFFVEFYDPVIDRFGVVQLAYCARDLTFTGQIDTECVPFPMVYSFAMNAPVRCTYLDAAGVPWTYTDLFYFWPGYIQESPCSRGFEAPEGEPVMDLTRDSTASRTDERERILPDERTLGEEQASLADLRAAFADETGETAPAGVSDDILSEPFRTSETLFGDPSEDVNALCVDLVCDDGNPCTTGRCDASGDECIIEDQPDGTPCSEGDGFGVCLEAECASGEVSFSVNVAPNEAERVTYLVSCSDLGSASGDLENVEGEWVAGPLVFPVSPCVAEFTVPGDDSTAPCTGSVDFTASRDESQTVQVLLSCGFGDP